MKTDTTPCKIAKTCDFAIQKTKDLDPNEKYYVSYNMVHQGVEILAKRLKELEIDPDVIVAIGSGGYIPARIMKHFIKKPIYTVGLSLYDDSKRLADIPTKVQWIEEVEKVLVGKSVLLIDETDDTRTTLSYCVAELLKNKLKELTVMVLQAKDKPKLAEFPEGIDNYLIAEKIPDVWICYPWEASDIIAHDEQVAAQKQRMGLT